MTTTLYIFCAIAGNMLIGAGVWAAIDDEAQRLYCWYRDCPQQIALLAQPLVLMAWPIGLWLWWKKKRHNAIAQGREHSERPTGAEG